jgi:predicted O-methyltransferase YrrM
VEVNLKGRLATSVQDMLLRTMVAQAVRSEPVHCLEIGTLFGTAAVVIYDALRGQGKRAHLTLIDPLEGYYNKGSQDIITGQAITEDVLRENLRAGRVDEQDVVLIKHLSTDPEAMRAAAERSYDVLIIDGDHSYAGVKADFENYASLVNVGGFIILDDYGSTDWPDVKSFVDQEVLQREWLAPVGMEWRTAVFRVIKTPPGSIHQ